MFKLSLNRKRPGKLAKNGQSNGMPIVRLTISKRITAKLQIKALPCDIYRQGNVFPSEEYVS